MKGGDLSLSMGPVQGKINEKFRLETSDIYGSLFEFLDGNDFKMSEGKELQERLTSLKVDVHNKLKQEQEGVAIIPALRPRNKDKLVSVLKNMSDTMGNRDGHPGSFSSVGEEKHERRSLNHNSFCSKRVSLMDRDNAKRHSSLSPEGHQDSSLLANINDVSIKKDPRNKKVSFQDGTFKENQKLDYSNIESRVGRYMRKKTSVLKGGEKEVALWNMYQIEGQNKKAMFLQYELNLLNKLAIKGEHHILKAQREVEKEGEEQNNPVNESYNKSFLRMKEGLKQLREKKHSRLYFDEDGNYISYAARVKPAGQNTSAPTTQTQNSFYSSPIGAAAEKKNQNESNRSIGIKRPGSETRKRDKDSPGVTFSSFGVRGDDEDMQLDETKKAPKKPKSKKLYLIGIDNNKWIGNHRTREKKEEVEKIINQKDQLDSITYMQKIRDTNIRAQRSQLKRIEEELIEKMGSRWKKRPYSVMRLSR